MKNRQFSDEQAHTSPETGQVFEDTVVPAMDAGGRVATLRTSCLGQRAGDIKPEGSGFEASCVELQRAGVGQNLLIVHEESCTLTDLASPNVRKFQ